MTDKILIDRELLDEFRRYTEAGVPQQGSWGHELLLKLRAALNAPQQPTGFVSGGYKQLGDFRPPSTEAPQQKAVANCTCGSQTFGDKVVHRQDGPCYYTHPAPSVPEGWHTADEKPEDGERVLCFEDYSKFGKPYKGMDCYYFRKGIGFVALPDDTDAYGGITHWTRPALPNSAAPKAPSADDRKDAELLDWLEQKRQTSIARGFQWDAFTYAALQSKKTIREQINAAIAAQKETKE